VPILNTQDLLAMSLPVDVSGYDVQTLANKLREAEAWVNGEARYQNGFEAHRQIDRVFGTGTNKLRTNFYPILQLNSVNLIFPANQGNVNLPGANTVPIDPTRVVIDHGAGLLENWSPFVFQTIGYLTVFPEHVPINIDYYTGYVAEQSTSSLSVGQMVVPMTNVSCFYYGQNIRVFDALNPEMVTVQSITTQAGAQWVVLNDPLRYTHPTATTIGDMPAEVRLAVAYVLCDFALVELNPENLYRLKEGNVEKQYQRELPVRSKLITETGPVIETERPLIKEARRLLEHFYSDRGIW
jgi:hypothetical protein